MSENIGDETPASNPTKRQKGEGSRAPSNFRWKHPMSVALLSFLVYLVEDGFKGNRCKAAAKHLSSFFNLQITEMHVNNHLRTWRSRWMKILMCRRLSGAAWDEERKTVILGEEVARDYVAAHPTHAMYINRTIEFYDELATIFGNEVAQGMHAMSEVEVEPEAENEEEVEYVSLGDEDDAPPGFVPVTTSDGHRSTSNKTTKSMSISQPSKSKNNSPTVKRTPTHLQVMNKFVSHMGEISKIMVSAKEEDERDSQVLPELNKLIGMEYEYCVFTRDHICAAGDHLITNPSLQRLS